MASSARPFASGSVPVGSTAWISNELKAIGQMEAQDLEEFAYAARNDLEWLNEHMADIFERNTMYAVHSTVLSKGCVADIGVGEQGYGGADEDAGEAAGQDATNRTEAATASGRPGGAEKHPVELSHAFR